jgi:hypothetical protein
VGAKASITENDSRVVVKRERLVNNIWLHVEATARVVEQAPNVGVLSGPRQYYAMLRNDTMTSMDRPVGMRTASSLGHGVAAAALAPSVCA